MPSSRPGHARSLNVLGLNSGTSIDSLDWALVRLSGRRPRWEVRSCGETRFPAGLQQRLSAHAAASTVNKEELARLDIELGQWMGRAVRKLKRDHLAHHRVRLVASHGQTIGHWPGGRYGATLQIGDPDQLAKHAGIPAVSHFRQGDLAVGGGGAPLTPAVNQILFQRASTPIAILNLGGMANLTVIPTRKSRAPVWGSDCGPANLPANIAVSRLRPSKASGRVAARMAAKGSVHPGSLKSMQAHPWFKYGLPASCGREEFGEAFVERLLQEHCDIPVPELIATLYALTAWSVARALRAAPVRPVTLYLAGGGAHNAALVGALQRRLQPLPVHSVADLGCDPDALEAVSFAVLGYLFVRGIPADLRYATGAARPALLGRLSQP